MFLFEKLTARCADYMKKNVNTQSCLDMWTTAKLFELNEVSSIAWDPDHICDNFPDVVETHEFLQLSAEQLLEILNSDEIIVESEENLFTSIMKWVGFDAENRQQEFENLITGIRMSEISHAFLMEHVLKFLRVIGSKDLFIQLCDNVQESKRQNVEGKPINSRKRNVYATYSYFENEQLKIQRYNQSLNSWEIAYSFNQNVNRVDVIRNRNDLFFIGGRENDVQTNEVQCLSLNALNPQLREITPMQNSRMYSASAKLLGYLYVTGGCNDNVGCIETVERLDLRTMQWTEVSPMHQKRSWHSAAVLSGKLFVTGGILNESRDSVEYYNPQSNSWTTVSSMNIPRYGHQCVVVNDVLYAIGGRLDHHIYLRSIEKYDFVADKWIMTEMEISKPLAHFGALVSQNWIFIGGGITTGPIESKNLEKLNIETGERLVLLDLIDGGMFTKLVG